MTKLIFDTGINMRLRAFFLIIAIFLAQPAHAEIECKIAFKADAQTAPLILAFKNNWLRAPGINFVPMDLQTNAETSAAFTNGLVDMALVDGITAVKLLAGAKPCVIICAFGDGPEMHSLLTASKSDIAKPENLKKKRIGVEKNSSAHFALLGFLEKNGLEAKIIELSADKLADARKKGQIDAWAVMEPEATRSSAKHLAFLENSAPLMVVASKSYVADNPAAVKGLVIGLLEGTDLINDKMEEAAAELAEALGAKKEQELEALKHIVWKVRMEPEIINRLTEAGQFLKANGAIEEMPDLAKMAPKKFIAE